MRFLDASGGTAPDRVFFIKLQNTNVENIKFPQHHQDLHILQPCNITGDPAPGHGLYRIQNALFGRKNMDYTGCDLQNYVIQNRTIEGANFTGADLRGANFANTTFRSTTFSTAKLDTTNFATSRFYAPVYTKGYTGTPLLPPGYRSINGYIVGANMVLDDINLNGLDLSDMNLSGSIINDTTIGNVNLSNVRLNSASWLNVDVGTSNLTDADLTGALLVGDFHDANLRGIRSGDTCFGGSLPTGYLAASQSPVSICNNEDAQVRGYIVGPGVDLSSRDLSGISMAGVNFSDADFRRANLSYANMNDTNLTGADLTSAVLYGTYVNNADFSGARLLGIATSRLRGTPGVPAGYAFVQGHIVGPQVDLYGTRIVGADLRGLDLSDADLSGAVLTNSDLSGADLSGARMIRVSAQGVKFVGSDFTRANVSRANLTNANLQTANLEEADLAGSTVTTANFTDAVFTEIKSGKLVGAPKALPIGYQLRNGYFVGSDADLTNAVLTGADLTGVNLSQARMTGLKSGTVKGLPLLPSGFVMRNGHVVGAQVNLSGANLSKVSLIGVNLTGTNLSNANLDATNLQNATLRYANLYMAKANGANFESANLDNAFLASSQLKNANFHSATLREANLFGAVLTGTNFYLSVFENTTCATGSLSNVSCIKTPVPTALPTDTSTPTNTRTPTSTRTATHTRTATLVGPPKKLLGWWRFNEAANAPAFADTSGKSMWLCATTPCAERIDDGLVGGGLRFAASNARVIDTKASLALHASWGVGMWVRTTASGAQTFVSSIPKTPPFEHARLAIGMDVAGMAVCGFGAGSDSVSTVAINDGAWHQIVCSYNAATKTRTLYVDGAQQSQLATPLFVGKASPLRLGGLATSSNASDTQFYSTVDIDEVVIYTALPSGYEIKMLYNYFAPEGSDLYPTAIMTATRTPRRAPAAP